MSNPALEGALLLAINYYCQQPSERGLYELQGMRKVILEMTIRAMADPSYCSVHKGKKSIGLSGSIKEALENKNRIMKEANEILVKPYREHISTSTEPTSTEKETETMSTTTETFLGDLKPHHMSAVNALLESDCGISVDGIRSVVGALKDKLVSANEELEVARSSAASVVSLPKHVECSGEIPSGDVTTVNAWEVFKDATHSAYKKLFDFDVPSFDWDGVHPDVPVVDDSYLFDGQALFRVLQGLIHGDNTYLYGHTGTGKSTMVEQVCAYLKWPLVRVNFDSEISRMDLIGRDTLVSVDGVTESKFVDGVVPDALARPCVLLCDEVDFIRPDVMYVFQRVLEGNGLLITEDGGRKVLPDPMFRLIATANTVGQGDDTSMYQGARPQSMATLDRFENWAEMKYMQPEEEVKWLRRVSAGLTKAAAETFVKYAEEHREAFMSGKIMQPLSPRGLKAMGKRYVVTKGITGQDKGALNEAMEACVLARCTTQDKVVLEGLVERVFG